MVSQKELLQETFADIMRGIGAAAKTMAPGLVSAYADVAAPFKAFGSKQPVMFLRKKLKTDYFNTFDYKSVRIGKPVTLPNDPQGGSRISVPFTAKRIKGISTSQQPSLSGSTSQQPSLSGGVDAEQTYTAILTRSEKGIDGEYSVEIRDSQNRTISGTKDKNQKQRPSWKDAFDNEDFTSPISIQDLANWIEDTVYLKDRRLEQLYTTNQIPSPTAPNKRTILDFITQILSPNVQPPLSSPQVNLSNLTADQINNIKRIFINSKVFNEQIYKNKKSQLNFLIDSYNMRYEVSINKGN